uniref:oxaloacetate tautomerase n=1 Tax=Lygus hesperus TaxID=30085 RepID=A0A0A9ZH86_LYGHE
MGRMANRNVHMYFTKPADTIVGDDSNYHDLMSKFSMRYPTMTESYHHEVELVVAIGPPKSHNVNFSNISVEDVPSIIYSYAVGIDMTRRDLQHQAKKNGLPWDLSKGSEDGAAIGILVPT